uniref:E3 ubiquitin-protein ligase Topors n=1 Tax=Accipiter nisus TaxID=211598 RepID=A0A8B9MUY3_9AVES
FSSVTPAAAVSVRGSGSTSPAPPSPLQHMESAAMELDNRCPICLDSWEKTSFVIPCLHQFCYPCIVRWAESKPECPLCKGLIISIRHSVQADDDFEEHVVIPPAAPPVRISPESTAPRVLAVCFCRAPFPSGRCHGACPCSLAGPLSPDSSTVVPGPMDLKGVFALI